MPSFEVWSTRGRERVVNLTEPSYIVGSDHAADVVLDDSTVSGLHARLDRVGTAWLIMDLGARNGTRVDGERLTTQRRLRNGQQVSLGRYRLVFLDGQEARRHATDPLAPPPANVTRAEKRVLVELCRAMLAHNTFQVPASVREIASRLGTGKNAVQFHLENLYDKFAIHRDEATDRRTVLAEEAVQRGAVTLADLDPLSVDKDDRDG